MLPPSDAEGAAPPAPEMSAETFERYDADHSGALDPGELREYLKAHGKPISETRFA